MASEDNKAQLHYYRLPDFARKEEKLDFLSENKLRSIDWQRLAPNSKHTWLTTDTEDEFESFLPIGSKEAKRAKTDNTQTVFKLYSNGILSGRDAYVYGFSRDTVWTRMATLTYNYNLQVASYSQQSVKPNVDDFVDYDKLKWSRNLKRELVRGKLTNLTDLKLRNSLYRPFTKKVHYFDSILNDELSQQPYFFPDERAEAENQVIWYKVGADWPQYALMVNQIPDLMPQSGTQCFPFYTYDADGGNRRENITDWALGQFRSQYKDPSISKWDIFYYIYGALHHPGYRERYALDLKRSLPRIPFAPEFRLYADAGEELAELHLNYETGDRYELDWQSTRSPVSYRVEKMLPKGKFDAAGGGYKVYSTLKYNDTLSLHGIPERAFAYRLGNRSALDWIVDQYRVKTDKRSGISHDPNGYCDDPQYILKLIERVVTVSLRTVDIVENLAELPFCDDSDSE